MDTLDYGVISATCHTAWYARLELRDAADLPSAQKFAAQTRVVLEERQVVKIVEYKNVSSIELRWPPQHLRVVRVRNDIPLVGAVVHALGQRVRHAEHEPAGVTPVPGHLERIVHGIGHIISLSYGAEPKIWPESVDVLELGLAISRINEKVSRIGHRAERGLVNVRLSLQVHPPAANISHAHQRFPEHLALEREIPGPRFRWLKRFALRGNHQRNVSGAAATRIIGRADRNTGVGLERWIPAKKYRVAHAQAGSVAARAGANDRLAVECISDAQAWLELTPLDIRVTARDTPEQPAEIELTRVCLRYTTLR